MPTEHRSNSLPTRGYLREYNHVDGSVTRLATYSDTGNAQRTVTRTGTLRRHRPEGKWIYPTPYHRYDYRQRGRLGTAEYTYWAYDSKPKVWYPYATRRLEPYVTAVFPNRELPSIGANLRRKAEIEALLALKDQKVNLGVALGEARETARFVGESFAAIGQSIRYLKRGNIRKSIQRLRRMSNLVPGERSLARIPQNWLRWQYAAKPLIGEVNGACMELSNLSEEPLWVTTAKGFVTEKEEGVDNLDFTDLNLYSSDVEWRTRRGVFVRLDYLPEEEFFSRLTSLGVTNPLEVVWELTPFSFVLDWAVGIGDWFAVLDATAGYRFLSGSRSELREIVMKSTGSDRPLNWQTMFAKEPTGVLRNWSCERRVFDLDRTVYYDTPFIALPPVQNPVSFGHVANGLSLLALAIR